jgi:hypothetical protein
LIAESSWVEQGNHIQRCNKLARNHSASAFASFEFLDSTGIEEGSFASSTGTMRGLEMA